MSNGVSTPEGFRGSPIPGCAILFAIVLVFGGLAVLYTVVGNYQKKLIGEFTQDAPAEIALMEPTEGQIETARRKLSAVETAVSEHDAERVLFTAEDLNVLIATLDAAVDFRGQTHVEAITSQGIVARMAQPLRKGIIQKGHRYLNGVFVFQPEVRARTIAFKVLDIRSDEGPIPQQFIESYAALDFFRLDPDNEAIESHIRSIETVYTEDGHLVVETRLEPREAGSD
ncbi:MAG: hypothetical protein WD342_03710 [Verrucomicrobiales bacterium]